MARFKRRLDQDCVVNTRESHAASLPTKTHDPAQSLNCQNAISSEVSAASQGEPCLSSSNVQRDQHIGKKHGRHFPNICFLVAVRLGAFDGNGRLFALYGVFSYHMLESVINFLLRLGASQPQFLFLSHISPPRARRLRPPRLSFFVRIFVCLSSPPQQRQTSPVLVPRPQLVLMAQTMFPRFPAFSVPADHYPAC